MKKDEKVRVVPLVDSGKTRGFEIEHKDGRKEAVVRPEPIRYKLSLKDR